MTTWLRYSTISTLHSATTISKRVSPIKSKSLARIIGNSVTSSRKLERFVIDALAKLWGPCKSRPCLVLSAQINWSYIWALDRSVLTMNSKTKASMMLLSTVIRKMLSFTKSLFKALYAEIAMIKSKLFSMEIQIAQFARVNRNRLWKISKKHSLLLLLITWETWLNL